jgi:hypothetical protein
MTGAYEPVHHLTRQRVKRGAFYPQLTAAFGRQAALKTLRAEDGRVSGMYIDQGRFGPQGGRTVRPCP